MGKGKLSPILQVRQLRLRGVKALLEVVTWLSCLQLFVFRLRWSPVRWGTQGTQGLTVFVEEGTQSRAWKRQAGSRKETV